MSDIPRKKTGGRKAGTPNKATADIRAKFKDIVDKNLETIEEDLKKLKPIERLKVLTDLSKFCIPTLKSVDFKGDLDVTAKKRITFVDKSQAAKEPKYIFTNKPEQDFIPPSNDPIF
jgi:hypothetical protein